MEDLGGALVLTSILECIIIIIMQVAIKKLAVNCGNMYTVSELYTYRWINEQKA